MRSWFPRLQAWAAAVCMVLWLAGCAGPQSQRLLSAVPADLPARAVLRDVPFFAQEAFQCGPAALATVLQHRGVAATPEQLVEQVYLPARQGSLQPEMLAAARRRGLLAYVLAPALADVLREVAAGSPVIVLQNLSSLPITPRWHYAVVVGYDTTAREMILHSGREAHMRLSFDAFERSWARGGHWAFVAAPPDRLPVTAGEARAVEAAVALERADAAAAHTAYQSILRRWPENFIAAMGLGNTAFGRGEPALAVDAFRRATALRPDAADAWNNLAHALLAHGQPGPALEAAQRAVTLGGPRAERYRQTLDAVAKAAASSR